MVIQTAEFSVGGSDLSSATSGWADQLCFHAGNRVFKSGPLFISSKGIGWASWKRRWFILTCTSLVFFKRNPSIVPQKGGEVNLTLGGIHLNSSGSVVVKEDKKLLTVLFPDGDDGRAFTLKAETLEDLKEWKDALEDALAQAPNVDLVMGHNIIFRNGPTYGIDARSEHPVKPSVVGRPILLALEDVNGTPSLLEKALRFSEHYGVKVEGIFRQSASVDDVARRIREYEQGNNEFSPDEDPHVVADCIKHVLRELPSSLVPASCCSALLRACRTERGVRVDAIRRALYETLPEPNCHLLKRILLVMHAVASHKSENRMSLSAVAACMAPLILRPLVAGNCELENGFHSSVNGSLQLLKAAAAANHAQAIVITLVEEYGSIFEVGSVSSELSESEESGGDIEKSTTEDILKNDECHEGKLEPETDKNDKSTGTCIKIGGRRNDDDALSDSVGSEDSTSDYVTPEIMRDFETTQGPSTAPQTSDLHYGCKECSHHLQDENDTFSEIHACMSCNSPENVAGEISLVPDLTGCGPSSCFRKSKNKPNDPLSGIKQSSRQGHIYHAKRHHSLESIDYEIEDETAIYRLENIKTDLQDRIAEEAKQNAILQASLERRKQALQQRRSALEQQVTRLKRQLQEEKNLREALEYGLHLPFGHATISATTNDRMNADLAAEIPSAEAGAINLKHHIEDLHALIHQPSEWKNGIICGSCSQHSQPLHCPATFNNNQKNAEVPPTSHINESFMQRTDIDMTETTKKQAAHLPTKQFLYHKQQLSWPDHDRIISSWLPATSPVEALVEPTASFTSRKLTLRNEANRQQGAISTSFALTKLTSRLNFLKEKRIQSRREYIQAFNRGSSGSDSQSYQNQEIF